MSYTIDTNTVLPIVIPNATTAEDGLMSAADKVKLDSLPSGPIPVPTMQEIYDASTGYESNTLIQNLQNAFGGGLFIQDNVVPINTDSLFAIGNSDFSNNFIVQGDAFGFGAVVTRSDITNGNGVGLFMSNNTAATALSTIRNAPNMRFTSRIWNPVALASQLLRFQIGAQNLDGFDPIYGALTFYSSTNGGALTPALSIDNVSNVFVNANAITTDAGGVEGGLVIAEVGLAPAGSPVGCGVLYISAGALRYKGTAGTDSPVAPA